MEQLHVVLIDVACDRLALSVADVDCARIVHSSPDACSIAIRARTRNLRVRSARQSNRCQREVLFIIEVTEENGCSGTVEAGVSSRVFRLLRLNLSRPT